MIEEFSGSGRVMALLQAGRAGWEKVWNGVGDASGFGILRLPSARSARQPLLRMTAFWCLGVVAVLLVQGGAWGQAATAVPQLEMKRFTGVWYEVARIPRKKDKCATDALAIYTAGDKAGRWALVNSCKAKDGSIETKNGTVKRQDKKGGDGRLKVAYTWPFYGKQWVLAVGPEYEWALVGSPNHKMLAVLSRTSTLGAEAMAGIKAQAAAGKMVALPQTR